MSTQQSASRSAAADFADLLKRLLRASIDKQVSDLHLSADHGPHFRRQGILAIDPEWPIMSAATMAGLVDHLSQGLNRQSLVEVGSLDGALSAEDGTRFRFNIYRRSGSYSIALRRLEDRIRTLPELGLPSELYRLADFSHGLVLIAGPTGSGKSTTLATLIDRINQMRPVHIITIEDPIEYIHRSDKALVDQREVGADTRSFNDALVASLRQDPDVVLVGEIRDLNTIRTAITAAETGHLVFSTVHAGDCVGSIDRLVSVFPADEQPGIRRQLSMVLRAVIAQRLVIADGARDRPPSAPPSGTPGEAEESSVGEKQPADSQAATARLVLASEVLTVTAPVANLIAQAKDQHIYSVMETSRADGMYTADECLARLYRDGVISERTARGLAHNPQVMLGRAHKMSPSSRRPGQREVSTS